MDETPPSQSHAFIAKLGAWLQAASVLAVLYGMIKPFSILRTSGAGDPVRLNEAIDEMLACSVIATGLSIVGLSMITVAITFHRYRAAWMFYFLFFYGFLMIGFSFCLTFFAIFGLYLHFAFGIFFLFFVAMKKQEFQRAAKAAHKLPSCYQLDP